MYYEDLTEYSHMTRYQELGDINVGWLASGHSFPTARPSEEFVDALWRLVLAPAVKTRGYHLCDLCPRHLGPLEASHQGHRMRLGSCEIRAFAAGGVVFSAPDLVFHYVREHHYDPPPEFKAAVLANCSDIETHKELVARHLAGRASG